MSATAGRPISGSPRPPHPPLAIGRRGSSATASPPNARHSHAKSPSWATSLRDQAERAKPSGPCAIAGTAERKTCIPRGSKSSSTRRSTRPLPGLPCMRCCATAPATSCSIIWASARTAWGWSSGPTAPTCPTSCAPISRSRWDCRSATRSARAAAAASLPDAALGSTFKIPSRPPRLLPSSPRCSRLHPARCWTCFASHRRRHVP